MDCLIAYILLLSVYGFLFRRKLLKWQPLQVFANKSRDTLEFFKVGWLASVSNLAMALHLHL